MRQGVLTHGRVRLLLSKGTPVRDRGRLESESTSQFWIALWMPISLLSTWSLQKKKGEKDIPGLTDTAVPHRLGPKRASRICKLFNLSKEDDVRPYVSRKPLNKEGKKPKTKAPKSQRLVTPRVCNILRKIKRLKNTPSFWLRE